MTLAPTGTNGVKTVRLTEATAVTTAGLNDLAGNQSGQITAAGHLVARAAVHVSPNARRQGANAATVAAATARGRNGNQIDQS